MKDLKFYSDVLDCHTDDDVFEYMIANLKPSSTIWTYFVNWEKVLANTKKIEMDLNTLNYLVGKENFDDEFKDLIRQNPSLAKAIPALVVRDGANTGKYNILVDYENRKLSYESFDFSKSNPTDADIEGYLRFVTETGLKDLITSKRIKSLVDYVIGVEAGLDSNGRKNRSGHAMESITEAFIADLCKRRGYKYLREANAEKIKNELGYDVPTVKASRRYDFVVDTGNELYLFETNYYGGGGSKLDKTASDYKGFETFLDGRYKFIWITDGLGWAKTTRPLREAFDHNDYIFTLAMLERGILDNVLN